MCECVCVRMCGCERVCNFFGKAPDLCLPLRMYVETRAVVMFACALRSHFSSRSRRGHVVGPRQQRSLADHLRSLWCCVRTQSHTCGCVFCVAASSAGDEASAKSTSRTTQMFTRLNFSSLSANTTAIKPDVHITRKCTKLYTYICVVMNESPASIFCTLSIRKHFEMMRLALRFEGHRNESGKLPTNSLHAGWKASTFFLRLVRFRCIYVSERNIIMRMLSRWTRRWSLRVA